MYYARRRTPTDVHIRAKITDCTHCTDVTTVLLFRPIDHIYNWSFPADSDYTRCFNTESETLYLTPLDTSVAPLQTTLYNITLITFHYLTFYITLHFTLYYIIKHPVPGIGTGKGGRKGEKQLQIIGKKKIMLQYITKERDAHDLTVVAETTFLIVRQ